LGSRRNNLKSGEIQHFAAIGKEGLVVAHAEESGLSMWVVGPGTGVELLFGLHAVPI
jgi:hypothetical protein